MPNKRDSDTRYFVEIDRASLTLTRCGYAQKQALDKGRQNDPAIHRLFLTEGQYNKLVERCKNDLAAILDT